jgi:hypothetical protein
MSQSKRKERTPIWMGRTVDRRGATLTGRGHRKLRWCEIREAASRHQGTGQLATAGPCDFYFILFISLLQIR